MSSRRLFRRSFGAIAISSAFVVACGWDPSRPFERESPMVQQAITNLGDGGDAQSAGQLLEDYLATGACKEGNIGLPPLVRKYPNASFDLGLALFQLGERYGERFGEEELDSGTPADPAKKARRSEQVDCALKLVRAVGADATQPVDLRARARYLEGNLLFLNASYEEAVRAYDGALELAPGMHDSGPISVGDAGRVYTPDLLGRDAAWNRAIALRRIEDKKDAGNDGGNDAGGDSGNGDGGSKNDDNKDGGGDKDKDKDSGPKDSGAKDSSNDKDSSAENDPKDQPKPPPKDEKKEPPPPSRANQDERMLDQLENAPTVQQEAARKAGQKRHVRGMSDK